MGNVRLENITKRYEDVVAVDDIDLDVEDGEFVTLVGPSGCGKSTTLETVAGLTQPSEGTVSIAGEEVTNLPPKDRDIAMVFQNIALFPHMDVYDNISFGLRLRDFEKDEIDSRVDRATEILQLEGMADRMPDELSGGQRQRVAIGRAIVREPAVFLMDEPLANLDAKLRVHMRTELQRLHNELETTIIYVTHDQAEAMTMSDRIAVMNGGELQQIAPPLTCYNRPANLFVAGFIGSPSMNLVEGTLTESGLETDEFDVAFDPDAVGLSPGDRVTVDGEGLHADGRTYPVDTSQVAANRDEPEGDDGGWSPLEAVVSDDGTGLQTEAGESLPVDTSRLVQAVDDRLTLGVRPENIYPVGVTDGPSDATDPIQVQVDVLEPMGDEVFVYLLTGDAEAEEGVMTGDTESGSGQLLMSVDPANDLESGEDIEVVLDREQIHLFDEGGDAFVHGLPSRESSAQQEQPASAEGSTED